MSKYKYNVNKYCIEKDEVLFAYIHGVDANRIVKLLNEQEEQLEPFVNLARDYNLTLNQLFDICLECIDKLDSVYKQKENKWNWEDRFICLNCKYCGYTEIGCLCEKQDHWEEFKSECNDFEKLKY